MMKKQNNSINFTLTNKQKKIGKKLTFFLKTYGCPSNERDSENIKGILFFLGFKEGKDIFTSDLVILNTCAIRQHAENKVFGTLYELKKKKNEHKIKYFGIGGCMSHEKVVIDQLKEKTENIDFVFGTQNIYEIPKILEKVIVKKEKIITLAPNKEKICEKIPDFHTKKHSALVNIMYGCNHFCTYCIVPFTRGRIKSRKKSEILQEVKTLIKNGFQEITLLGQNVNSYGNDWKNNYHFANLLEEIAKTGIKRIRFNSSNPWDFDQKIIDVVAKYPNIIKNIHIPIQSGDECILKQMNRQTKIKEFISLCKTLRKKIKDVTITTDLIVGFPNETRKQFMHTIKLYKKIKFDGAYTFVFSPRYGTKAAKINDKIPLIKKEKRLAKLNKWVKHYAKYNNKKYIGRIMEVLVDGPSKMEKNVLTGRTINWKIVNFKGNYQIGEFCKVKILSANPFSLKGEIINE